MSHDTLSGLGRLRGFTLAAGDSADLAASFARLAEVVAFRDAAAGEEPDVSSVLRRLAPLIGPGLDPMAQETCVAAARRAAEAAVEVCLEAALHAMTCPTCGVAAIPAAGVGPHFGQLRCPTCSRHLRWIPKPRPGQGGRR